MARDYLQGFFGVVFPVSCGGCFFAAGLVLRRGDGTGGEGS